MNVHCYETVVRWSANGGEGTKTYRSYRRDHTISAGDKPPILSSSDPAFRGDALRYNPEELLVASLSSCHMLWYLHLCAVSGITALEYRDAATGLMEENEDGSGQFVRVALRPVVTVSSRNDLENAQALHQRAHRLCFIARSVNFPVEVEGVVLTESSNGG
jgi:organic hydroperoxide reductase OsmC/OhrA